MFWSHKVLLLAISIFCRLFSCWIWFAHMKGNKSIFITSCAILLWEWSLRQSIWQSPHINSLQLCRLIWALWVLLKSGLAKKDLPVYKFPKIMASPAGLGQYIYISKSDCLYLCPLFTPELLGQSPPNFEQTSPPTQGRFLTQAWPCQPNPWTPGKPKLQNLNGSGKRKLFVT